MSNVGVRLCGVSETLGDRNQIPRYKEQTGNWNFTGYSPAAMLQDFYITMFLMNLASVLERDLYDEIEAAHTNPENRYADIRWMLRWSFQNSKERLLICFPQLFHSNGDSYMPKWCFTSQKLSFLSAPFPVPESTRLCFFLSIPRKFDLFLKVMVLPCRLGGEWQSENSGGILKNEKCKGAVLQYHEIIRKRAIPPSSARSAFFRISWCAANVARPTAARHGAVWTHTAPLKSKKANIPQAEQETRTELVAPLADFSLSRQSALSQTFILGDDSGYDTES